VELPELYESQNVDGFTARRADLYFRTEMPSSITPYMVMPLDPPADDDPPDVPAHPAHTAASSATTNSFSMKIPSKTALRYETPF